MISIMQAIHAHKLISVIIIKTCIALHGISELYGASPAIWDHTVLPATRQGRLKMQEWKMREWKHRHESEKECSGGKYGSGNIGTVLQGWKMQEWKHRHGSAGVENAGVETSARFSRGGKCGSRGYGTPIKYKWQ